MDPKPDDRDPAFNPLQQGDDPQQAMRLLVERYGRRLYWHIRHLVLLHEDAEDALQETFVKAFVHRSSYKGKGSFEGWLYRIATNEALQTLRRRRWHALWNGSPTPADLQALPADEIDLGDRAAALFTGALATLPPRQRAVFSLRYYDDMPYEEVAGIVGISVSNAKTTYHYAKSKIEEYIKHHSDE